MLRHPLRSRLAALLRPVAPARRGAAPSMPARYLTGLAFPATTTTLMAALVRNDAPAPLLDWARGLRSRQFATGEEVVAALRER
ncbi:MAG: hypothetical protein ACRDJH_04605 [Thermomicrobiales bacterium]